MISKKRSRFDRWNYICKVCFKFVTTLCIEVVIEEEEESASVAPPLPVQPVAAPAQPVPPAQPVTTAMMGVPPPDVMQLHANAMSRITRALFKSSLLCLVSLLFRNRSSYTWFSYKVFTFL